MAVTTTLGKLFINCLKEGLITHDKFSEMSDWNTTAISPLKKIRKFREATGLDVRFKINELHDQGFHAYVTVVGDNNLSEEADFKSIW